MSRGGFLAAVHPTRSRPENDDRRTPQSLFDDLHAVHSFTVDAAASTENAKLPRYWTIETDGLSQPWHGERVWCNPPFSNIAAWVEKAERETSRGCELVVMLLPANRTEQPWWQDHIEEARASGSVSVRFLRGRTKFEYANGVVKKAPPFGCCLVTWRRA